MSKAPSTSQNTGATQNQSIKSVPDKNGFYGKFGGQHIPESLAPPVKALAAAYAKYRDDPDFKAELAYYLKNYAGRETPLFLAANLTKQLGGAKIYLKREDLLHLGAHKVNNTLGQILLAKRMGKTKIIAETGAGQHGVATAATAARMGMKCTIYMGAVDVERQYLNVERMRMLGAQVVSVTRGDAGLKDAIDEALITWINDPEIFYLVGSAVGPHPYPEMVRDFQSVIGIEARRQMLETESRLPDYCMACVGGGSNAMGLFHAFVQDTEVKLIGVEPGGIGNKPGENAAPLCFGSPGILHGTYSYMLQDEHGEVAHAHSISAGLDYPGVGPEHSYLKDTGRAEYVAVSDSEALDAFFALCRNEGIIPALESSHALAYAIKIAPTLAKDKIILVNLSGRGDKDLHQIIEITKK
jgi:tryptophan synthase beta chain